jgi:glutamate-1-semialdehyde 2,1-aminomutase
LGKIIGGGMPVGAFGGRRDIMAAIAPLGGVYQAGTLSGNPVSLAAGLTTLRLLQKPGFYDHLATRTRRLTAGLQAAAQAHGVPFCADSLGGMFGMYFTERVPTRFAEVQACDGDAFKRFFHGMLNRGVYLAPSAFEAGFVSIMHVDEVIDATVAAANTVFGRMA